MKLLWEIVAFHYLSRESYRRSIQTYTYMSFNKVRCNLNHKWTKESSFLNRNLCKCVEWNQRSNQINVHLTVENKGKEKSHRLYKWERITFRISMVSIRLYFLFCLSSRQISDYKLHTLFDVLLGLCFIRNSNKMPLELLTSPCNIGKKRRRNVKWLINFSVSTSFFFVLFNIEVMTTYQVTLT